MGATDKKACREDIDTITWQYTLKPSTIPIPAYEDDSRQYLEVALLQVSLQTPHRIGRIAEIIQRAIPYPLVVIFSLESKCALSVAHKAPEQREARLNWLAASRALEDRIAERKAAIRAETQFNRQVELNAEIKRLEQELRQVADSL